MSLFDKLKSMFGGSQSASSPAHTAMDEPAAADTHDHDHEGHEHSHDPMGDKPAEPKQN